MNQKINNLKRIAKIVEHKTQKRRLQILFDRMINFIKSSDFVGLHCQSRPRSSRGREDTIGSGSSYAQGGKNYEDVFPFVLDGLTYNLRDKASELGLLDIPDKYTDEHDIWYDNVIDFLDEYKIRWIWTDRREFLTSYGEYCYLVQIPEKAIIYYDNDPNMAGPESEFYVYDSNIAAPRVFLVEDYFINYVEEYLKGHRKPELKFSSETGELQEPWYYEFD